MSYLRATAGPIQTQPWLAVPEEQKAGEEMQSCCSAGASHRTGKEDEKESPAGPTSEIRNCLVSEQEGLDYRRQMWKGVKPPALASPSLWGTCRAEQHSEVLLISLTFTLGSVAELRGRRKGTCVPRPRLPAC